MPLYSWGKTTDRRWAKRLVVVVATVCAAGGALARSPQASKGWAPLSPAALEALYAGKTWRWKRGAAYFSPDGRFKAWSREGGKMTEGRGSWDVREGGLMCFTATWETASTQAGQAPSRPVETCFGHEARSRAIAQMRLPKDPWYFFRHAPPRKTDEIFKLQAGDRTHIRS